jgi:hypothetical protein
VDASVETIQEILHDPEAPANVRAGAAFKVLEMVFSQFQEAKNGSKSTMPEGGGLSDETVALIRAKFLGIDAQESPN